MIAKIYCPFRYTYLNKNSRAKILINHISLVNVAVVMLMVLGFPVLEFHANLDFFWIYTYPARNQSIPLALNIQIYNGLIFITPTVAEISKRVSLTR